MRDTGEVIYNVDTTPEDEKLDFSAIDANPAAANNQAFTLTKSTTVTAHGKNYFEDGAGNTRIWVDTDGNTVTVEMEITLMDVKASSLTADGFTLRSAGEVSSLLIEACQLNSHADRRASQAFGLHVKWHLHSYSIIRPGGYACLAYAPRPDQSLRKMQ